MMNWKIASFFSPGCHTQIHYCVFPILFRAIKTSTHDPKTAPFDAVLNTCDKFVYSEGARIPESPKKNSLDRAHQTILRLKALPVGIGSSLSLPEAKFDKARHLPS